MKDIFLKDFTSQVKEEVQSTPFAQKLPFSSQMFLYFSSLCKDIFVFQTLAICLPGVRLHTSMVMGLGCSEASYKQEGQ